MPSSRPPSSSMWTHRDRRSREAGATVGLRRRVVLAIALVAALANPSTLAAQTIDFKIVTYNTGTTQALPHDADVTDGYTSTEAAISDTYYGDGLAWPPAIAAVTNFLATESPEIVAFQEIFDPQECGLIPSGFWPGFICETWTSGDPLVVEQVLGPDYQIACHQGKTDKCVAVHTNFGSFEGCTGAVCLDGLDGASIPGCGSGSRVGRGRIQLVNGGEITVAHIHGTSGSTLADALCRQAQVDQLFVDLDGTPAADGVINLVLGDFNTDPARVAGIDPSAAEINLFVGSGLAFDFLSPSAITDPATYPLAGLTLDHVISDDITGSCEVPGFTPGVPPVFSTTYFDHSPIVCVPEPGALPMLMGGVGLLMALARRRR